MRERPQPIALARLVVLLASGVLISCETHSLTPSIGVTEGVKSGLEVIVYVCRAGQPFELTLLSDPDGRPDTGDEMSVWEIKGRASSAGTMRFPVDAAPPRGFREEIPLTQGLEGNARYVVTLKWSLLDQAVSFLPDDARRGVLLSGGGDVLSFGDFKEAAEGFC